MFPHLRIKPRLQRPDEGTPQGGGEPTPGESFDVGGAMDALFDEVQTTLKAQDAAAPPPPQTATAPAPPPPAPPPPAPSPRAYPKSWKPDHAPLWDTLPETHGALKDMVLQREDDFHRGIEGYKSNAQLGERFNKILAPFAATLQQYGVDPDQLVGTLLNAQMQLALGRPEERLGLMRRLLADYKIDPATLIEANAPAPNPQLDALTQEINTIKSTVSQQQQNVLNERRAAVASEVETFAKAHEHFEALQSEIVVILQGNPKATLQDAYDQAMWMNPAVREKVLSSKSVADAAKAQADAAKRAEDAAKASKGSIRTPARSGSPTAPAGSMEDTMRETLAAIKQRG